MVGGNHHLRCGTASRANQNSRLRNLGGDRMPHLHLHAATAFARTPENTLMGDNDFLFDLVLRGHKVTVLVQLRQPLIEHVRGHGELTTVLDG
jgi:hypothetical protein